MKTRFSKLLILFMSIILLGCSKKEENNTSEKSIYMSFTMGGTDYNINDTVTYSIFDSSSQYGTDGFLLGGVFDYDGGGMSEGDLYLQFVILEPYKGAGTYQISTTNTVTLAKYLANNESVNYKAGGGLGQGGTLIIEKEFDYYTKPAIKGNFTFTAQNIDDDSDTKVISKGKFSAGKF